MKKMFFVFMLFPYLVFSQINFWTQTSLTTGRFDAIIVNDSGHVFAGGQGSGIVYHSTDLGYTWSQISLPLAFAVSSFGLSPEGILFAGTDYGIFYSSNNGNSWVNIGLQTNNVSAITFHQDGTLYAGTSGNGIYKTTDSGTNWSQVGPSSLNISSLIIPSNEFIFATAYNGGVYRSDSSGINWDLVGLSDASVKDIAIDNNGKIYACTMITFNTTGVFLSSDNGDTWDNFLGLSFYYAPYGGIISNSLNHIFLGTYGGVYRSTGSSYWVLINDGLTDMVYSLAVSSNGILYAGGYSKGIFRSVSTTSIEDENNSLNRPDNFILSQNYPNPFNPSTKINYSIPQQTFVTIKVYDVLGNEISVLLNEEKSSG